MNEKEELKPTHTPHDKGYKRSLSKPKEFLHFLKKYVRADWMMELEESQLSLCDKEFVDKDYEGREADLVYKVEKTPGEPIYVFILQELQSTVDYTMIFRILIYVVNNLLRFFLNTEKEKRERSSFRLPAMVPIVFYNGEDNWTAVRALRDYQIGGKVFGNYVLNLEYYLVNLSTIEEADILSTNTVLDNIMYCDKSRRKLELAEAIKTAYDRIQLLGNQEKEEFNNWVKAILLSVCGDKETVMDAILSRTGNGVDDMAFKYNIIKAFEDERAEGKAEGIAEGKTAGKTEGKTESILELLEDFGEIPNEIKEAIMEQKDLSVLKEWHKKAARVNSMEEFENFLSDFFKKD